MMNMPIDLLLISSIPFLAIAAIVAAGVYKYAKNRDNCAALSRLAGPMHASFSGGFFKYPALSGHHSGLPFTIELHPPITRYHRRKDHLSVTLNRSLPFEMQVCEEEVDAWFGERYTDFEEWDEGLKASSPGLLDGLLVKGDGQCASYLQDPANVKRIREVIDAGFPAIRMSREGINAARPRYDLEADLVPEKLSALMDKLAALP
ncbi:MAG: hypothetical protein RQ748_04930 [Elusimicrobiales bacterium]|nr:hypothetical protein [Elusimicrobiales bacterium]